MPPIRPLQREQAHHKRAFEVYGRLGAKRSFKAVAREMSLSVSAVRLMARSFHWADRLLEREATAARQVADQDMGSTAADAARKRKMVDIALFKVIKAINADKVRVQVGDLDRLLRLQAFLDGGQVPLTLELFRAHTPLEVLTVFFAWHDSLSPAEREQAQKLVKQAAQASTERK